MRNLPGRIRDKVRISRSGCWEWTSCRNQYGYGKLWWNGENRLAHRVVYQCAMGEIPNGLTLDHLCRVRHCVNPAHLEPVTSRENTHRGVVPSIISAKVNVCVAGRHELSGANIGIQSGGKRYCKACKSERERMRRTYASQ